MEGAGGPSQERQLSIHHSHAFEAVVVPTGHRAGLGWEGQGREGEHEVKVGYRSQVIQITNKEIQQGYYKISF